MPSGRHASKEAMRRAVAEVTSGERLASDVAVDLGVQVKTVHDWVRRAKQRAEPVPRTSPGEAALRDRIAELEKQVADATELRKTNASNWADLHRKLQAEVDVLGRMVDRLIDRLVAERNGE